MKGEAARKGDRLAIDPSRSQGARRYALKPLIADKAPLSFINTLFFSGSPGEKRSSWLAQHFTLSENGLSIAHARLEHCREHNTVQDVVRSRIGVLLLDGG